MSLASDVLASAIVPALVKLDLHSPGAERLLMGTAAVESRFVYRQQFNGGPARGLFQMEPATFDWLMNSFLAPKKRSRLKDAVLSISGKKTPLFHDLTANDAFAAAMARIKYYSVPAPIPSALADQANYWWVHYNGRSPHGLKPANYIARWTELCAPLYGAAHNIPPPDQSIRPETTRTPLQIGIWI